MSIHHPNFTTGTAYSSGTVFTSGTPFTNGTAFANGTAPTDGSSAVAASPPGATGKGGGLNVGGAGQQPGPVPDNVVELYPGCRPPRTRQGMRLRGSEAGMATAEYAIATLAAVGFAGLLVFILRSDEVRGFLLNLIRTALALP